MEGLLKILVMILMGLTTVFLVLGFFKMGSTQKAKTNRLMTWRVWSQAGAFLILALLLYMKR